MKGALAELKYLSDRIVAEEVSAETVKLREIGTMPSFGSWNASKLIAVGPKSSFAEESKGREVFRPDPVARPLLSIRSPDPLVRSFSALPAGFHDARSRPDWLRENAAEVESCLTAALDRMTTLSLDVFDTFMLRGTESEAERFHLFSDYVLEELRDDPAGALLKRQSLESMTLMRARGMQLSYKFRPVLDGCGEGSINEVAKSVALAIGGGQKLADRLIELEVAFEARMLTANIPLGAAMKKFKARGGRIILISDMYLHGDQISRICARVDPDGFDCVDAVYSSADTLYSKRAGKLFPLVETEQKLDTERTIHVGDSYVSDVERARQAGWNALHFPVSRPEQAARSESLRALVSKYDTAGIDIRDWAKV